MSRFNILPIALLATTACGPTFTFYLDDGQEVSDESGGLDSETGDPPPDLPTATEEPCDPDPLQGAPCDPYKPTMCPGGHCTLVGGPVMLWVCEMEIPGQEAGAPCSFNEECTSGVCVPIQYHPAPDPDATIGACGLHCPTEDPDSCEPGGCQMIDVMGVEWGICLSV
jgi:hypothetical protein